MSAPQDLTERMEAAGFGRADESSGARESPAERRSPVEAEPSRPTETAGSGAAMGVLRSRASGGTSGGRDGRPPRTRRCEQRMPLTLSPKGEGLVLHRQQGGPIDVR